MSNAIDASNSALRLLTFAGILVATPQPIFAGETSGSVSLEARRFAHRPAEPQHRNYFSLAAELDYTGPTADDRSGLLFTGFGRIDQHDAERSHVDIRELAWIEAASDYEWRLGIRRVFWGATEAAHLVDIINQTDLVENPDGEDKLGQPMINLAIKAEQSVWDFFVLPFFRERTFPGTEGRLRAPVAVDTEQAAYGSSRGRHHVDYALRWTQSNVGFDFGLSYFVGTAREPTLVPGLNSAGAPVLIPRYELIRQAGMDLTAARGSWLWKAEAIYRTNQEGGYAAATGGLEYTWSGVFGTGADLGLLVEYLYDERGPQATTSFQDDVFVGVRWSLNDSQSAQLLFGVIDDRDSEARFYNLEASRRLGRSFKLSLQARVIDHPPPTDPLFVLDRDDYMELVLARYF